MTLSNYLKNGKSIFIELELYKEDDKTYAYVSNDGSSGYKFEIEDFKDIGKCINDYIEDHFDGDDE